MLAELMDEEVDEVVGSKGRHDAVTATRPARSRSAVGRDPLTAVVLEQMLAGVSTRRFSRTREPVGEEVLDRERSTSKSAVSREFVGRTGE